MAFETKDELWYLKYQFVLTAIALVASWFFESFLDIFLVGGSFMKNLLPHDPNELWARSEIALAIILANVAIKRLAAKWSLMEARLIKNAEELKKGNEQIKMFAYSVIHDLKSPVIGMRGLARILLKEYSEQLGRDGLKYCRLIDESAENMENLVKLINEYIKTKEASLSIREINPKGLIKKIRREFLPRLNDKKIELVLTDSLPEKIRADEMALSRIFRNLFDNSIQHGGKYVSEIEVGCEESSDSFVFWVKDNGAGLKVDDPENFFQPFGECQIRRGGSGLGLAIIKTSAERHNGKLWLDPAFAKGAAFFFSIPKGI